MAKQDAGDDVIYLRAAGLDLGKRFLVACVRVPSPSQAGRWSLETERFATTPGDIRRLLAWLVTRQVEVVVLEATSDYRRYVCYTLQPELNLMLVTTHPICTELAVTRGQEIQRLVRNWRTPG
jgi:transposase